MTVPGAVAALLAAVYLLSIAGTGAVLRYARRRQLLDRPNHRSLHRSPTPRGGGLAPALAFLAGAWALGAVAELEVTWLVGLTGGLAAVAGVGWLDDHGHVPPLRRLAVHAVGAVWAVGWCGGLTEIALGGGALHLGRAGAVLGVVVLVGLVNLYNFMDGIDGLAGGEALTAAGSAGVLLWVCGDPVSGALALLLAATAAGFLFWNRPPARIFLGDVGSGALGFALGLLLLRPVPPDAALPQGLAPWVWALLLGVFLADGTVTLLRRACRGEVVWRPHRLHAYQRLARRHGHAPVAGGAALVNLLLLWPAAWLAAAGGGELVAVGALAVLAAAALRVGSGAPEEPTASALR